MKLLTAEYNSFRLKLAFLIKVESLIIQYSHLFTGF